MHRCLKPELLDELPPTDRHAIGSRRDLERLNLLMGHAAILGRALTKIRRRSPPKRIVELGAGDGTLLLKAARKLPRTWAGTKLLLVDRQEIVSSGTRMRFNEIGWSIETCTADVFDWIAQPGIKKGDAIVANLFLHHFSDQQLQKLFEAVSKQAEALIAIEPRRSRLSLAFSKMLWFIGCNHVTRHDAFISVQAGFNQTDLSRLWTTGSDWLLGERSAGWFSHELVAVRDS